VLTPFLELGLAYDELRYEIDAATKRISIRTKSYSAQREVIVQPSMMPGMQMQGIAPVAPTAAVEPAGTTESTPEEEETTNYIEIKSPMVGTFYRSASPEKPSFVKVGDTIGGDDTVCLIEAMKLFNEVQAEVEGRIVKVMVEDASPVEYGQVLFLVESV